MAIFEDTYKLTIRDIDNNTQLTNKAILSCFEDIGGQQSDVAGFGLKTIEQTHLSWVLLHWKVQVIKRIKYGNLMNVKTWSRGSKGACCYRDFEIYNNDNELCVIGTSKWALIHLEKGLMKLNDELLSKYESEDKCVFGAFDINKLKEPESYSNVYEYIVTRRDIDINNHMHNLYYLDLAYNALPQDVYENNSFDDFEIMYKSGALLDEKLKCLYSKVEDEHYVTIKSEDEKILHAIVKLKK